MVVGIDIGGTKTHIALRDAQGNLRERVIPSDSWRRGGLFGDSANANRLVAEIHMLTGGSDSGHVVVGAHGCDTPEQCERFADQLRSVYGQNVTVVNDAQLLVPAAGQSAGVAVIVGTGSIVVGASPTDTMIVAGGHGWLFGDPGSAPGVVREAVKKLLTRRDEGRKVDILGRRLIAHFGVSDITGLIYALSVVPKIDSWAAAAPVVFEAAADGSETAIAVIEEAAAGLAANVINVHQHGAIGNAIVCAGGVITNQPRLYSALRDQIADIWPDAAIELLSAAPVFGALALADAAESEEQSCASKQPNPLT
ncbi:BadF/BadG/BcrA/BcrD ATPase family protein [Paramicrobacterium chengjingii]|uniref:ATPase BadF/BadG/BcrA/BcrD type domain-containing protein n=1 Tax=Paramicrobacterium chengjingii TaxID=2769067 RepID=A0ABX6YLI2_9MICO|nr:BadF/BadG/BcrA/BcrD ATPase family protein [Microbacterium chengjingii]QPZ39197.1 hypothetical protein HCR76_03770 [Microbacterium chengjingii]